MYIVQCGLKRYTIINILRVKIERSNQNVIDKLIYTQYNIGWKTFSKYNKVFKLSEKIEKLCWCQSEKLMIAR